MILIVIILETSDIVSLSRRLILGSPPIGEKHYNIDKIRLREPYEVVGRGRQESPQSFSKKKYYYY